MALNYSHFPSYPPHMSEDNLVSPMNVNGYFLEGIPEIFWEAYGMPGIVEGRGSPDSISTDIAELLPADPFGMDNIKTTVTTISGLFEDLCSDYERYFKSSVNWANQDNSGSLHRHVFKSRQASNVGDIMGPAEGCRAKGWAMDGAFDHRDFNLTQSCNPCHAVGSSNEISSCATDFETEPHEGLVFALKYLGLKDRLSVEKVCKSLYERVRGDALLWCSIHIDQPLNEKITDDFLVQLASRAQGDLQCLSLVECLRVTVDGLRRVLEANPRLTKLCVPGCTRLSVEGILDVVRAHNSKEGVAGINLVRIAGLNVMKSQQLEDLKSFLASNGKANPQSKRRPHYHRWESVYLTFEDEDRPVDVEECPRCDKVRLVYDCPAEGCQAKGPARPCRACKMCIPRCDKCGTCIDERVFEETFCLDVLCSDCYRPSPVRFPRQDVEPQGQQQVRVEE